VRKTHIFQKVALEFQCGHNATIYSRILSKFIMSDSTVAPFFCHIYYNNIHTLKRTQGENVSRYRNYLR